MTDGNNINATPQNPAAEREEGAGSATGSPTSSETPLEAPARVWVLVIASEYGCDPEFFRNEEDAKAFLFAWVEDWWNRDGPDGRPMPEDRDQAIDDYFSEGDHDESYHLGSHAIDWLREVSTS